MRDDAADDHSVVLVIRLGAGHVSHSYPLQSRLLGGVTRAMIGALANRVSTVCIYVFVRGTKACLVART